MKILAMKIHELLLVLLLLLCVVLVGQRWFHSPMLVAILLGSVGFFSYFFIILWLKPERVRQKLRRQGIKGPKPCLLYGNVPEMQRIVVASAAAAQNKAETKDGDHAQFIAHDYTSTLFPYFEQWRKQYGTVYTYSTGDKQHLYVNNAEIVKEMNQSISLNLGKPTYVTKRLAPMLGNGILRANGQLWFQQRKIVAPELFMNKIKGMVGLMIESTESLLTKWSVDIEEHGNNVAEIRVDEDLRSISADVISRACFGSSYFKGKEIFHKLRLLQKTISKQAVLFGLSSFGSTFLNGGQQKKIKSLENEIDGLIWDAVKERKQVSSSTEKDLMQLILEGAVNDHFFESSSKRFIVDNCKNIYFAGHESTAVASSWCLMMLALHPEWQARVRNEMAEVCQDGLLSSDSLTQMKSVTMVIQETMRLYPPAAFVSREALEDIQIGQLSVPKGVCTWTLIPTLHRDPDIWGKDANEFKPERFEKGVSGACKVPHAYVPFGLGPRLCLGRNFAMVQLKIILSMIISRFTFSLSPNYQHSPTYRMIVEPGNGVHIVISKLE